MRVNGSKGRCLEMEHVSGQTGHYTKDHGKIVSNLDKGL
jgi:hypothetical protein